MVHQRLAVLWTVQRSPWPRRTNPLSAHGKLQLLGNQYGYGEDALGVPSRTRLHTDDSIEYKYYDRLTATISKAAMTLTGDAGCESGGGVSCRGNTKQGPKQSFLGFMFYNRLWFDRDKYGLTIGGGRINNPGRYLVLLPPINGATAASGTPYFTENLGNPFKAWDTSVTADYMPSLYLTYRLEYNHRAANVPYFAGPGGVTPQGGNTGGSGVGRPRMESRSPQQRESDDSSVPAEVLSRLRLVRPPAPLPKSLGVEGGSGFAALITFVWKRSPAKFNVVRFHLRIGAVTE